MDEYQDISRQRFDLTKALSEVTDAKIIAVGDDWQSIYAFSGSDITLFTKFAETMGYAKMLKIVKTYRNSQEVIDIAGNFIQRNSAQIKKRLISPKRIEDPVIIYTYNSTAKGKNGNRRSGADYALARAVEIALGQLLEYKKKEKKEPGPILLLGRFGFDGDHLERSGLFEYINRGYKIKSVKYPKLDITFMTAHSSKGLGYDDVIIINGKNETYGFPSKIEDDPVLSFVIKGDRSIDYAEERRLFYVAMKRTKNRVFFIAPEQNPSEFLLEIKRDYKNVILNGDWNENEVARIPKKACPICGYPMQLKYKRAYGLRLYICTNEPEICGFMTNDYRAGKMSIQKCDMCRDGYLIVKQGRDSGFLLGCTNYKLNGTGCNRIISKKKFYNQMGFEMEEPEDNSCEVKLASEQTVAAAERKSVVNGKLEDDYIHIVRADVKSVMYETIKAVIEWMIAEHLILKTKGRYPVLHSTYEGLHYSEVITEKKLKELKKYLEDEVE
ncbi:MAG: 3'-5' exonuclease [Agathobacter sp.]